MKIIIKADIDEKEDIDLVFSNEELSNFNFVEIYSGDELPVITMSVDDLAHIAGVFKGIKKEYNVNKS